MHIKLLNAQQLLHTCQAGCAGCQDSAGCLLQACEMLSNAWMHAEHLHVRSQAGWLLAFVLVGACACARQCEGPQRECSIASTKR